MITQAFILGAGLGTRLRPLTADLPKPLIPIYQKPLITFALDHLAAAGVETFVINTHHRAPSFQKIFVDERYKKCPVRLVHEPEILGTGGGMKNIETLLRAEPFIVYSGDLLTDIDLTPLVEQHFRERNDVTLALRETGLGRDVALQGDRVVDIGKKYGRAGEYDFANISVWNPNIFRRLPSAQKLSFIPIIAEWIGQGGKIGGVVLNERQWFNIGARAQYLEVHRFINEKKWRPDYISEATWPVSVAADAVVDPSARLSGFYSIGAGCRVGAETILEDTILWPGVNIASRSQLHNCIVRSHSRVEGHISDTDI